MDTFVISKEYMNKKPEKLIEGCLKGKLQAQRKLFELYKSTMMGICMRYSRSRHEAEDILIEGFVNIFKKMHTYSSKGSFEGWMKIIMVHSAIDYYRKNKKQNDHLNIDEVQDPGTNEPDALEQISAEEIMQIINELPPGYRMVFNLFAVEGYSHQEIARLLNITESTSKSQYRKARLYIMKKLEVLGVNN